MTETTLIVHLPRPWTIFHRRHMLLALAEALPDGVVMLCVDRPVTLDVTPWRNPRRFFRHIWRSTCVAESSKLRIATVRTLLHDDILRHVPWLSHINAAIMGIQLKKLIRKFAPENPRIAQWIYRPEQGWISLAFPGAPLVYECYDEYSFTPAGDEVPSNWRLESPILKRAALTFVTASSLLARRRGISQRIQLIPNGVPDFFLVSPRNLSDPIDHIPHPRIGYVGVIRAPMHMTLLRDVFRRHPEWHLVLVGPVESDAGIGIVSGLPNVHILGSRPFESLPAIMRKLDVGLIPHRINQFSIGLRPLKLVEYLASGLPVVATRLPELASLEQLVDFSDDSVDSFASAVSRALGRTSTEFRQEAHEWAREFTWRSIVAREVLPALQSVFASAPGPDWSADHDE